jgi:DNA modification methylase
MFDDVDVINDDFDLEKALKETKVTKVKTGEVWQLGEHRLLVGDSTDSEQVQKLMSDERADIIYCDPPYNIGLDYSKGVGTSGKYDGSYTSKKDSKKDSAYAAFITASIAAALSVAKPNAHLFYWCDERYIWLLQNIYQEHHIDNKRVCLWIKNNFNVTPQIAFNKVYEPCIYGTIGKPHLNKNIANISQLLNQEISTGNQVHEEIFDMLDLWLSKRDAGQDYAHPTQKPVSLNEKPLKRCSAPGHIVFSGFAGSGSDLIACEQLNRKWRGWGRFQDQDEAAHYEFLCKQHGKKVIYVSQGFPKEEEQLISTLQTSIGRYMAADYSRQLSGKVFHGCVKVSQQGFSAGGLAAYGMSRLLLDVNKQPIKKLKKGEWKSISNERVTFTPAEDETTDAVKEMFTLLVDEWQSPQTIAETMNEKGVLTAQGKQWQSSGIHRILTNEVYVGTRIYNKVWGRLKQKSRQNPRSDWVILPEAFPHVVTTDQFKDAQERLYWIMPSKWRKGAYALKKAALNLQNEVVTLLLKGGMSVDDTYSKITTLPVVLGVCFYIDSVIHWCFVVEEYMKNYDYVLGVSLDIDRFEPVDRFFWIPIDSFDKTNFIVFSERDEWCTTFTIPQSIVEEKILSLIQ